MVICRRKNAKSTCGRAPECTKVDGFWLDGAGALTGNDLGSTLELAAVTTCCAGISRLWPTAMLLAVDGVATWAGAVSDSAMAPAYSVVLWLASASSATAECDIRLSLGSHGK